MKIDGIVGLFINSVPVRVRTEENDTVTQALKNLQAQAAESAAWDFCPLARIQSQTDLGQALFQSTMVFENYPVPQGMDETLEEWNFRPVQTEEEPFNELSIVIGLRSDGTLEINIAYDSSLYPQEEIRTVENTFTSILQSMAEQPDVRTEDIRIVTEEEQIELIKLGTGIHLDIDINETFVSAFERQATKTPERMAVADGIGHLTYAELSQRSNLLPHQ